MEDTEKTLEKEICRENKAPPKGTLARARHRGERFLHSKHVLMAVVILNLTDCILVMGELIFDIHYIVDVLEKSEQLSDDFIFKMEDKYPYELSQVDDISQLYQKVLHSAIYWNTSDDNLIKNMNITLQSPKTGNGGYNIRNKRDATITKEEIVTNKRKDKKKRHKEHTVEEDIAHGFHKASITILAILVIETALKMFCQGLHMLDNKMEVFDSFVVIASFILDIAFIKGITVYSIQEFVFILAFLVPWRVLRVVNSLIVAIIDHEHFRMKLLYKQKKQILIQFKEAKKELKLYEKSLQTIEQLCISSGIPESKLRTCTVNLKSRKKKALAGSCGSLSKIAFNETEETTPMMDNNENRNGNLLTVTFKSETEIDDLGD